MRPGGKSKAEIPGRVALNGEQIQPYANQQLFGYVMQDSFGRVSLGALSLLVVDEAVATDLRSWGSFRVSFGFGRLGSSGGARRVAFRSQPVPPIAHKQTTTLGVRVYRTSLNSVNPDPFFVFA